MRFVLKCPSCDNPLGISSRLIDELKIIEIKEESNFNSSDFDHISEVFIKGRGDVDQRDFFEFIITVNYNKNLLAFHLWCPKCEKAIPVIIGEKTFEKPSVF